MNLDTISIIIPIYNEEKHIASSLDAIRNVLYKANIHFEFIIIDDGSKDNTWQVINTISQTRGDVFAIKLSRNFGKEAALCAGLEASCGKASIVMDADLQHPPQLIPKMVKMWEDGGFDIIEAVKSSRGKESFLNKICSCIFYIFLEKLSGFKLDGASDFKLLDKKVVDSWKQMRERDTFFRGMSAWVGFNRTTIPFEVPCRAYGDTKWSTYQLIKLAITALTSFSTLPLQIVTLMGGIFLLGSLILGLQTLYMKLSGIAVTGFTTVILLLLVIGSTLMISLGIIGTYIANIYDEVKSRPRYIIEKTSKSHLDK